VECWRPPTQVQSILYQPPHYSQSQHPIPGPRSLLGAQHPIPIPSTLHRTILTLSTLVMVTESYLWSKHPVPGSSNILGTPSILFPTQHPNKHPNILSLAPAIYPSPTSHHPTQGPKILIPAHHDTPLL